MGTTKLPDPDVHLAKKERYDRLRAAIQTLSTKRYRKMPMNRWLLNFIPLLKRTDRDCGALPVYSREYTAQKPNKDHALLCLISMLVQVYWSIADESIATDSIEYSEFDSRLERLELIVATGYDNYVIAGKSPHYMLLTEAEIADDQTKVCLAEIEGVKQDKLRDDEEAIQRTADELVQNAVELGLDTGEDDGSDPTEEHSATGPIGDGAGPPEDVTAISQDTNQLSVEDADKCLGDCDTCEPDQHATCDGFIEEVTEIVIELDEDAADEALDELRADEHEVARRQAQDDDNEQYPDVEDLEQSAKDAIPPIPGDDDESSTAGNEAEDDDSDDDDEPYYTN
jgi:hypothetical protein